MVGSNAMDDNEAALARLIVNTLNLDFRIEGAYADTPLYGEGFGLDSIDILEVALEISRQYGVKLRSDDENNTKIFKSLRSLSNYIQDHKSK